MSLSEVPSLFSLDVAEWVRENPMPVDLTAAIHEKWTQCAHTVLKEDVFAEVAKRVDEHDETTIRLLMWIVATDATPR